MANAGNVRVGKPDLTGGVYAGSITATAPTDATTAIPTGASGYKALGYVGEDGLAQSIDTDTSEIKAWGGDTVRKIKTSHQVEYKLTFIESSADVLSEVFGAANVTTGTGGKLKVAINSGELPRRRYIFSMNDGGATIRVYVPNGQITEVDDLSWTDGDPVGYPVTISCYPDGDGNKAYLFLDPAA